MPTIVLVNHFEHHPPFIQVDLISPQSSMHRVLSQELQFKATGKQFYMLRSLTKDRQWTVVLVLHDTCTSSLVFSRITWEPAERFAKQIFRELSGGQMLHAHNNIFYANIKSLWVTVMCQWLLKDYPMLWAQEEGNTWAVYLWPGLLQRPRQLHPRTDLDSYAQLACESLRTPIHC